MPIPRRQSPVPPADGVVTDERLAALVALAAEYDELGGFRPLVVVVREDELPSNWVTLPRKYIARFTNVLGEGYVTRASADPTQPHTFERIDPGR